MPNYLFKTREIEHVIDSQVSELPPVVTSSVVKADAVEILKVAMGYVDRRELSELNVHRKLYDIAVNKFSPARSMDIVNRTVYDILRGLEKYIDDRFRIRLHYTTHYLHDTPAGIIIEEFETPIKSHKFHSCPLCNSIERKPT